MRLFDILGPVMVGPSSSHTAGAVRIGLTARKLLGDRPVHADISLHGSFALTGHGHGTDCALIAGLLGMQPDVAQAMDQLRTFMFARVYTNPVAKGEESKAKDMLCRLFEYYMKNPERLPPDFLPQLDFDGMERIVCDYIAGMTDRYAVYKYSELFIPATWQVR